MKKLLFLVVVAVIAYGYVQEHDISIPGYSLETQGTESDLQNVYKNKQSDLQVKGEGVVAKVLRDDVQGSRHQKFILKLSTGQTVMVAHNIDIAPRISRLRTGDSVAFYGEYEWNAKGGVIHWTHHDPAGRHIGGWLKHGDKTYQ